MDKYQYAVIYGPEQIVWHGPFDSDSPEPAVDWVKEIEAEGAVKGAWYVVRRLVSEWEQYDID